MNKMAKKNWIYLAGGIVGGIGGFLYWHYVGCRAGTCPITSSPVMSILFGVLFGSILFSLFAPKSTQSEADFKKLLNDGALLLDVRTKGEFASGHVKDSKNIPLDRLGESLHTLNKGQNIIVVCASGMRSSQAVSLMKKNGFTNCYNGGSWLNFNG